MLETAPEKEESAGESASIGTISVTSDTDGAEIFIDSVGSGHTPAILKLPRGKHSVQIVGRGFKDGSPRSTSRKTRL
jgi:hypothetical protein